MEMIHGVIVNKEIEKIIKEKIQLGTEPYQFFIRGVISHHYGYELSAIQTWKKIKQWAIKHEAEANLIENKYDTIRKESLAKHCPTIEDLWNTAKAKHALNAGQNEGYLLIEITDPCAQIIESIKKEEPIN